MKVIGRSGSFKNMPHPHRIIFLSFWIYVMIYKRYAPF